MYDRLLFTTKLLNIYLYTTRNRVEINLRFCNDYSGYLFVLWVMKG